MDSLLGGTPVNKTHARPQLVTFRAQVALSCMRQVCALVALVCLAVCGQAPALGQTVETWTDSDATKTPPNNNWSDGSNWSGGVVPNGSNYSADVPLLKSPYTFPTMDTSITLSNLTDEPGIYTLMSPGVTLTLVGQSLIGGLVMNAGTTQTNLTVNSALTYSSGSGANCCLQMFGNTIINGSGTLINEGTIAYGTNPSGTFGAIGTSAGSLTLQNASNIYSGQNSLLALYPNNNWTNSGTIQSANHMNGDCLAGTVYIQGGTINQTGPPAGQLFASSGLIALVNNTIQGGTLATDCGGGGIIKAQNNTLNNLTISDGSAYQIPSPGSLNTSVNATTLVGTITNNGTITVSNTDAAGTTSTYLKVPSAVILASTSTPKGSVVLAGGENSVLIGTGPLTNQETITGQGKFFVDTIINEGTIAANAGGGNNTLEIGGNQKLNNAITNTGTITADSSTSIVQIVGGNVNNTGGTISAGSGIAVLGVTGTSPITVTGGNVIGGVPGSGLYVEGQSVILTGTSTNPLTVSGLLQLNDGDQTTLEGTIVNNGDIIESSSKKNTEVKVGTTTTISGTGIILFANDSAFDELIGTGLSDRLNLNNNVQGNVLVDDLTVVLGSKNTWETGPDAGQPTVFGPSSSVTFLGTFKADPNTTTDIQGGISNYSSTTGTWSGNVDLAGTLDIGTGRPIKTWNGKLTLENSTGALLTGGVNALDTITNFGKSSNVTVGSTAELNVFGPETFSGTVDIQNGGLYLQGSGSLTQPSGKTTVDGTLTLASAETWSILGGTVFGAGTVNGDESLGATSGTTTATETVGDSSTAPGTFHINGTFTQNAQGKIVFVITPTATSQLVVTGDTTLGGNVTCTVQKGYTIPHGYLQIVLTAPQITGTWAANSGCAAEGIEINYSSTEIIFKKP